MSKNTALKAATEKMDEYKTGDRDERPWGSYIVTGSGKTPDNEEYCEKEITVAPGKILSLQSHNHRRETWQVLKGKLTVILNDRYFELSRGETIHIPQGALHCMANTGSAPCIVFERQEGLCREDDIIRYVDAYGRNTEPVPVSNLKTILLYKQVLKDL
jgi:mannose-6-phosphate isomerase-like protein (cupin superfamily)